MTTVVAALIQQNGKLLICQRGPTDRFPLKWEFPGGKLAPGESPANALARELAEELGISATVGAEVYRTRHRYAELPEELELIFFLAALPQGSALEAVQNLAFHRIEWAEPASLAQFDFLPADRELIALISSGVVVSS